MKTYIGDSIYARIADGQLTECPECEGTGHAYENRKGCGGHFQDGQICNRCKGSGRVYIVPAPKEEKDL